MQGGPQRRCCESEGYGEEERGTRAAVEHRIADQVGGEEPEREQDRSHVGMDYEAGHRAVRRESCEDASLDVGRSPRRVQ